LFAALGYTTPQHVGDRKAASQDIAAIVAILVRESRMKRHGEEIQMKWEYKVIYADWEKGREPNDPWEIDIDGKTYPIQEALNLLGQQRWELVTVQAATLFTGGSWPQQYGPDHYYIFKRPAGE
jgi:hypothetical protein